MTDAFVFDTYALIELIEGNPAYVKYASVKMILNEFIFAEFCYVGIKRYRDYLAEAEQKSRAVVGSVSAVSPEEIMEAMKESSGGDKSADESAIGKNAGAPDAKAAGGPDGFLLPVLLRP